jgi:hypothetical protein
VGLRDRPRVPEEAGLAGGFVREEIEPLDYLFPHQQFVPMTDTQRAIINPLKDEAPLRGNVLVARLNRPEARNALNRAPAWQGR